MQLAPPTPAPRLAPEPAGAHAGADADPDLRSRPHTRPDTVADPGPAATGTLPLITITTDDGAPVTSKEVYVALPR